MSLDKRSIELGTEGWGVKEDNLLAFRKDRTRYVEKPFTFSRATEGTIVNSDGYIQYSGVGDELVTNGGFDTDSDWTTTSSVTIENGKANFNNTPAYEFALRQLPISGVTIGRMYKVSFDLTVESGNIAVYLTDPPANSEPLTESGSYVFYFNATNTQLRFRAIDLGFTGSIDNVSLKEVEQETPRISYDIVDGVVSDKPHLLLEPARINHILKSNSSGLSAPFNYNVGVLSNEYTTDILSPENKPNARKVLPTGNVNQFRLGAGGSSTIAMTPGIVYTASCFIHYDNYRYVRFGGIFGNEDVDFDLQELRVIRLSANAISGKAELYKNNWIRLSVVYTFQNAINNFFPYLGLAAMSSSTSHVFNVTYPTLPIYTYGWQIEEGNYHTSYMPTFGTTATRAAETANNCGAVQDFNDDEGVLFVECAFGQHPAEYSVSDGTNSNRITILTTSNSEIRILNQPNTFDFQNISFGGINDLNRIALKYSTSGAEIYVNGASIATDNDDASFAAGTLDRINLDRGTGANPFYGKVKELKYFPETLNDAELRLLTKYAPKDYDAAFTADYVDSLAEFTVLRTEATDKLYYSISDGTNSVSGSATITATQVTISNIDISSLTDGTLTLSVYIEDERKQRGVTVTDTTIKDTTNTPLYSYALQQRATGATFEDLDNSESIIESLNVEV